MDTETIKGKIEKCNEVISKKEILIGNIVKGNRGIAKVQSICAGGWDIQRSHVRTLVHKVTA